MVGYDVRGAGPLLVLVHGSWDERAVWDALVPLLAQRFRVITYDRRGHGGTPGTGSTEDDAADLEELITVADCGPARVVGNSFGAIVALRLLVRRPELVLAAALHEPPLLALLAGDRGLAPVLHEMGECLTRVADLLRRGQREEASSLFVDVVIGPGTWSALPESERAMMLRNADTFAEELEDPTAFDADLEALRHVRAPILLTGGETSPPFFSAVLDRLQATLPRARRVVVAGAGHVPHATHPDAYSDVIVRFFDELQVGSSP